MEKKEREKALKEGKAINIASDSSSENEFDNIEKDLFKSAKYIFGGSSTQVNTRNEGEKNFDTIPT